MKMTSEISKWQRLTGGMPDMAKMMKIMIYVSPIMMLFFFNSYVCRIKFVQLYIKLGYDINHVGY
jgi:hypothetical protein